MVIKCITFDITNTLIRVASGGNVALHYSNIIHKKIDNNYNLNIDLANQNFRKFFKLENSIRPGYGFSKGMNSRDWWANIVKNVIKADLDCKNKSNIFDEKKLDSISNIIFDEFVKAEYWEKYSNCDSVLTELKNTMNVKLGVISNFDERLYLIMKNLNLDCYFDFVCIPSNSQGFAKPSSEIFTNALIKSGCQNESEILHVGDNYDLDYKPARDSNFNSILLKHCTSQNEKLSLLKNQPENVRQSLVFDLDEFLTKLRNNNLKNFI
ncbi:unnamed protein product [Brachionus calyciflorus]|uniref:Haloacid dehalogenase-like hydrolase domain-containing protein 3 n=1 Tax=Brachionus calyciflorus TaxID=104777 RepID=A0A814JQK5_9BILA|nr:unnamed protein product [Brachionus calyciflorus]